MKRGSAILFIVMFCVGVTCPLAATAAEPAPQAERVFHRAVVTADHPLASQAGAEMFRCGGNVVDAAVATSFALSVVRPASCGIGGGGFMVIWNAEAQRAVCLDYRERAPQAAHHDMYVLPGKTRKADPLLSRTGHLATGVPGTVAGLCYAQRKYGLLDLKIVLEPAIRLARGFAIDKHSVGAQESLLRTFAARPGYRTRFAELFHQYLDGGRRREPGDRVASPQLKLLQLIAQQGPDGFYRGPVADAIVSTSRRGGGLITHQDLAKMRPVERRPLLGRFGKHRIVTMPPASSGGVALLETFNILSAYEAAHPAQRLETLGHNSPRYVHLVTEAMKHAFADRAAFLGDADFADVPVARLTGSQYAQKLAVRIDLAHTKPLEAYGRFLPVEDSGTSHVSVIDKLGNAVACTETINMVFGSFVVVPEFGIVLNNEMDDFAALPGTPNAFGLIQSEANAVEPRKKPLSSMTPTILLEQGKAVYVAGGSGGPTIISATIQVLLNMSRFGKNPTEAVALPRFHHQWIPNQLFVEPLLMESLADPLRAMGHDVKSLNNLAAVQAASRSGSTLRAAGDPRRNGLPAGE